MPDYYTVTELNYEGSPAFWGRSPVDVRKNMDAWHADFAIIYDLEESFSPQQWQDQGLGVVTEFSWAEFRSELITSPLVAAGWPVWRLMGRTGDPPIDLRSGLK